MHLALRELDPGPASKDDAASPYAGTSDSHIVPQPVLLSEVVPGWLSYSQEILLRVSLTEMAVHCRIFVMDRHMSATVGFSVGPLS
jgi:hypothetical protein